MFQLIVHVRFFKQPSMHVTSPNTAMPTRQNSVIASDTCLQNSYKLLHCLLPSLTLLTLSPLKHNNLPKWVNFTQKWPANIGMHLLASYLHTNANSLAWFWAIDVTIQALPTPLSCASQSTATATSHHQHHKEAEWKKQSSLAITLAFKSLKIMSNKQHILLLPFTVDHLGGIGWSSCILSSLWPWPAKSTRCTQKQPADKNCTASHTYIHVLSWCHLYPLPVTGRVTNVNFQKILFLCTLLTTLHVAKRDELRYHCCLSQLYFIGH
jgi:hypothetical protein